jgi:cytochrome c biogenesis protein ResB
VNATSFAQRFVAFFSSLTLAGVLLGLLALLTFLGTLAQVDHGLYDVQRRYFESLVLVHHAGPVPIPLPGGGLVMGLLFVNLLVGGVARIRKGARTAGVIVAHLGMLVLLASGFVEYARSIDGHTTLYEGRSADWFQSYTENELFVAELVNGSPAREWVVPARAFAHAEPGEPVRAQGLPFELEVTHWFDNADIAPKGPMFEVDVPVVDGFFVEPRARDKEAERNGPAAVVRVFAGGTVQEGLLWTFSTAPWTVDVDGRTYAVDLRRARYPLPFTVRLDDFKKEDHPGTTMPAWFSSDVTVTNGGVSRPVLISMNEPLRESGVVAYQASWGPPNAAPGTPLFSTLAVVRNPADQWPLVSCVIIAAGLLFHFGRMLVNHVRREVRA